MIFYVLSVLLIGLNGEFYHSGRMGVRLMKNSTMGLPQSRQ